MATSNITEGKKCLQVSTRRVSFCKVQELNGVSTSVKVSQDGVVMAHLG